MEDPINVGGVTSGGELVGAQAAGRDVTGGEVAGGELAGEIPAGSDTAGADAGDLVLRITPRETSLVILEGQPPPQTQLELQLVSARGEEPIEASAARWSVDAADIGNVVGGLFTSNGRAGSTSVIAEYDLESGEALAAYATITVSAPQDFIEEGLSVDDLRAFDEASLDDACSPITFVYPEPLTTIPLNLRGFTFQWSPGQRFPNASGPFLVTARAGDNVTRWLTNRDLLTPEGIAWESVKVSDPNGVTQWSLSYLTADGARCESPALTVIVDRSQITGAVYYWSTTDSGIMRLAANEEAPEPFLTPQVAPEINCPACHALSRDGTRVAFTRTTFPPFGDLATSDVDEPRMLKYDPAGVEGYFPSFSPDPNVLIAGSSGRLVIRDSETGEELDALMLPMGMVGGSPDWSWIGDRIVAVVGASGLMNPLPNVGVTGGIYEWVRSDDQAAWGAPTEVIPIMGDTWNTNPAYAPDDSYIAYNVEGENPSMGDQSMGNTNIDLWIKRVGDQSAPVRLNRANRGELQGNSWPKWVPHDRRGKLWIAFSSLRDYGHQLVQDADRPIPQLWVTAIDPQAPPGQDPSSPAFWLPYQSLSSGNHIPYWAPYEKR